MNFINVVNKVLINSSMALTISSAIIGISINIIFVVQSFSYKSTDLVNCQTTLGIGLASIGSSIFGAVGLICFTKLVLLNKKKGDKASQNTK